MEIAEKEKQYLFLVESKLSNTYKFNVVRERASKWLIVIAIVCLFTGLLTPIKDMPYTYILRTEQGETTQNINEHLPLVLINNEDLMTILAIVLGMLIFTRTKIKIRDFFMLAGLIFLTFMTQRQASMLILIGNFILARLVCEFVAYLNEKLFSKKKINYTYVELALVTLTAMILVFVSVKMVLAKKYQLFIKDCDYPVGAAEFINNEIIPKVGKENLRIYNDYNYGSYLLFQNIPVFIDSRCDLYTQEFNGKKNEKGKYIGRDIFNDAMNISRMNVDYDSKFNEYSINYVVTYSNAKLADELSKDDRYNKIYDDGYFVIYKKL